VWAAATVCLVALAACGGDGKSTTATEGGNGSATTKAAADSGKAGDVFCNDAVKLASEMADAVAPSTGQGSAGDLEASVKQAETFFKQLADKAPAEIKSDFKVYADAFAAYAKVMAKYDYDFTKLMSDPEAEKALEALNDPKLEQAGKNIEAWIDKNCAGAVSGK
jgi:hypothetical protein